jgi:AraC-like DNA-binding protein
MRALIEATVAGGVDREALLAAAEIDPASLEEVDAHVPLQQLARLWFEAAKLSGDPDFGLNAGQRLPTGSFGVLEYAVFSSPNLGEAFDRVCRYNSILLFGSELQFEIHEKVARFSHSFPSGLELPRHAQEFVLACVIVFGRRACGLNWTPTVVQFTHERPEDISAHEALFGCPIEFGSPMTYIEFDRALLARPLVKADAELLYVLDRHVETLLKARPAASLADQVRDVIVKNLPGQAPSLDAVAHELNVNARTLQRRLKDEGSNHHGILEAVRRQLASNYLSDRSIALGEVAFLLGFSDPSAFHRAFRRWMGMTPAQFRTQAA